MRETGNKIVRTVFALLGAVIIVIVFLTGWQFYRAAKEDKAALAGTVSPVETPAPVETPVPTVAVNKEETPTETPAPTEMPMPTATLAPTMAPKETLTPTPTPSPSPTPEPTATATPSPTPTPTPTPSPSPTATPTPTPTPTPKPTATPSPTPTPKPTATPTPTPTPKPTATPTPTPTPTPTSTPTPTPSPAPAEPYLEWVRRSPGKVLQMNTLNTDVFQLEIVNFEEFYGDDYEHTVITVSYSTEGIVEVELDDVYSYYPEVYLTPQSAGETVVTLDVYETDGNGNPDKKWDTLSFRVVVEEFVSKVELNPGDYVPAENGYPYLIGEWPCGDDVIGSIWWDGKKGYSGKAVLLITGTGEMWDEEETLKNTGNDSRQWCDTLSYDIVEIHVCEGITRTEFMRAKSVGSRDAKVVTLPSTVMVLGEYSFCEARITEIQLPAGLKRLERGAFSGCDKLESLVLPDGLEYIGMFSFWFTGQTSKDKNLIAEMVIPDTVTYVGEGAFHGRYNTNLIMSKDLDTSKWHKNWTNTWDIEQKITYK